MPMPRRTLLKCLLTPLAGVVHVAAALPRAMATPVATPATAPLALPLLSVYRDAIDPAPYLVSEKYDGVRGVWDGRTLRFRSGRPVAAPAWFTAALPAEPLDGELWLGRQRFDAVSALVRREVPVDAEWRALRYMVFDLPAAAGSFEARTRQLAALVAGQVARAEASPLVAVPQRHVADRAALHQRLDEVVAAGGEGLVLKLAAAPYQVGRTDAALKLKPSLDAEAVVVAHHPGRGRLEGQLGALEVRTPQGRQFLLGTGFSAAERRTPPPVGSRVTYRYRDLTRSGLPRFASFLRPADLL